MAWDEILEQDWAKRILQAHLAVARFPTAYLFEGPEGIGKRRVALEMAKALNCEASQRPCDVCPPCRQIARGIHPDLHVIGPSGASLQIKIDDMRHLLGRLALRPFSARVQVVVIEEAERMTEEAANSLLKTLEEPSATTRFFLTTIQRAHCLPTILSRCQLIRCHTLSSATIERRLLANEACSADTAPAIARLSGGSLGRAFALASDWERHEVMGRRLADEEAAAWFERPLPETREDVASLLDGMLRWLRDVAVTAGGVPEAAANVEAAPTLKRQAARVALDECLEAASGLVALRDSVEQFVSPRLIAAMARERWLNLFHNHA